MLARLVLVTLVASCAAYSPSSGVGVRAAVRRAAAPRAAGIEDAIDTMVKENKVFLFMKGNPNFPQCGFSNTAVQILNAVGQPYESFDVLSDNAVREGVKAYSNWPTIPQLYVDGEFLGGCDIMIEMYQDGSLAEEIEKASAS